MQLEENFPEMIGTYQVRPFAGIDSDCSSDQPVMSNRRLSTVKPGEEKLQPGLKAAVEASGLKDGMTISFHHSFREGDQVIGRVLSVIKELGIKGLKFAPSAVVNIKNPSIVDYVKDGTIASIEASGIRGELGDEVLGGVMDEPVILRPHGARPRAIEAGNCPSTWHLSARRRPMITAMRRALWGKCLRRAGLPLSMR